MKNSGDNISSENANWKFSGKMVKDFEKHVSKSVPIYERGQDLIVQISDFFVKKNSVVYDIGCSTGKLLFSLYDHNKIKGNIKFIGIDVEKDMIDYANNKLKEYKLSKKNLNFINNDVVVLDLEKNDLLISFFTIQFIQTKHRQDLINKIYNSLNWGGAFLFFEKVRYNDARFQDIFITLYNDYKLEKGYSPDEIINKARSLKGILEPFSTNGNLDMLKRAGFEDITTVIKDICFEGFLAIK